MMIKSGIYYKLKKGQAVDSWSTACLRLDVATANPNRTDFHQPFYIDNPFSFPSQAFLTSPQIHIKYSCRFIFSKA